MANWHAKTTEQRTEYNGNLKIRPCCEYVFNKLVTMIKYESMQMNSIQEQVLSDNCIQSTSSDSQRH